MDTELQENLNLLIISSIYTKIDTGTIIVEYNHPNEIVKWLTEIVTEVKKDLNQITSLETSTTEELMTIIEIIIQNILKKARETQTQN